MPWTGAVCCLFCLIFRGLARQVIDLGDTMTFAAIPGQADTLSCNMPGVPLDDSNLVIKVHDARYIMQAKSHVQCHSPKSVAQLPPFLPPCIPSSVIKPVVGRANSHPQCCTMLRVHMQALNLYRRHTGSQQFFQVHLEKKVPHGALSGTHAVQQDIFVTH